MVKYCKKSGQSSNEEQTFKLSERSEVETQTVLQKKKISPLTSASSEEKFVLGFL